MHILLVLTKSMTVEILQIFLKFTAYDLEDIFFIDTSHQCHVEHFITIFKTLKSIENQEFVKKYFYFIIRSYCSMYCDNVKDRNLSNGA